MLERREGCRTENYMDSQKAIERRVAASSDSRRNFEEWNKQVMTSMSRG